MISLLISIPIFTVLCIILQNYRRLKLTAILGSFLTLILSLYMTAHHSDYNNFVEHISSFHVLGMEYYVSLDGLSSSLVVLTTLLTFITIFSTTSYIKERVKEYICWLLVIESLSILVFTAQNLLLFYIAFELILVPMYFIIGIWGGENRIYACMKFFLYTFFCSIFMLLGIIYIYTHPIGSTDCVSGSILNFDCINLAFSDSAMLNTYIFVWLGIFLGLAAKIPMVPVHTWLPDAHVQAPTGGSMILAGILLKLGGYGMIKISLPLLNTMKLHGDVTKIYTLVYIMSVVAIIYGSLVAFAQKDMKKMIAYSSIAHMGYVTAGIFSNSIEGYQGAVYQMLSHGIISAGLFFVVGTLYERTHTKEIAAYGGFAKVMPKLATFFMILTLGSVGLPGTSGFIGEILSTYGLFKSHQVYGGIAATGVVLSAVYMLTLYKKTMFGDFKASKAKGKENANTVQDLSLVESLAFSCLCVLVILFGFYPKLIISLL